MGAAKPSRLNDEKKKKRKRGKRAGGERERERRLTILVRARPAILPRLRDPVLQLCAVVVRGGEQRRQLVFPFGGTGQLTRDLVGGLFSQLRLGSGKTSDGKEEKRRRRRMQDPQLEEILNSPL